MKRLLRVLFNTIVPLALVAVLAACSSDDNKKPAPTDTTAPSTISTLTPGAATSSSVVLSWTAPGDDGATGTAHQYDVRYSTATITAANFASAHEATGEPTPVAAGSSQTMTVNNLFAETPYFFAMKASDEAGNVSAISNVVTKTTLESSDVTAPSAITTLATGAVTATSVVLNWTAPGNDGTTGTAFQYDLRYSTATITEANFAAATQVTGEPAPVAAGGAQTMTVTGLTASTPYFFAIKASDGVPNWSGISNIATGTTSNTADTTPPAAISTLAGVATGSNTVDLTWHAPGDDGSTGTAAQYDVRYSSSNITAGNFASATAVTGEPTPAVAGTEQGMTISGLTANSNYYFAMKAADEAANASPISNVVHVTTPVIVDNPPTLTVPDFPDTICIDDTDQYAVAAKSMVTTQLFLANWASILSNAFLAPFSTVDWDHSGDCWDASYTYQGCGGSYHVCLTSGAYAYTLTLNGTCGGDVYDNWVAFQANVDYAARTGTYKIYDTNSTAIVAAWVSTWGTDQNSGTTTFYDGDPATAAISALIDWSRTADHKTYDVTYIVPENSKWESHISTDPCSGLVRSYAWDSTAQTWWKDNEISWTASDTGYWDTFDQEGTVLEHHAW